MREVQSCSISRMEQYAKVQFEIQVCLRTAVLIVFAGTVDRVKNSYILV